MSNIFNPAPGQSFDANGVVVEKPAETEVVATEPVVTDPATQTTTDTVPEAQTSNEPDWGKILAEKTGGKFSSWDELTSKIDQQEVEYANEESKKIAQYIKEGKIDDVLQVYNEQRRLASTKDMSDTDVLKLAMEYKHATLSPEEIHDEISSKYSIEKPEAPNPDDYLDEDAFAKAEKAYNKELAQFEKGQKKLERQLKLDATEAREYLDSLKKDIVLPDITPTTQTPDPAEYEKAMQDLERSRQDYLNSVQKSSVEFKEIPFKVNDEGVAFEGSYQIDDAERQQLQKDLTEKDVVNDLLLSRYVKEDSYDTKQLMEDLYWLNNKEKIIASAVKQALSKGKLETIRNAKNVDLDNQHRGDFTPSTEAQVGELARAFFKAG